MTITALDTHEVVKELRAVGFTDEQAEAVTRAIRQSHDIDLSNLVAETDYQLGLVTTKTDFQMGLAAAKADLQIGLAETKSEILKWMVVGMIGVQTVIIVGAVVALVRYTAG